METASRGVHIVEPIWKPWHVQLAITIQSASNDSSVIAHECRVERASINRDVSAAHRQFGYTALAEIIKATEHRLTVVPEQYGMPMTSSDSHVLQPGWEIWDSALALAILTAS
eukprot:CAMPEP_0117505356 /NCGR_PEP_ID=MMETSP0784-20121206/25335_1 /TAXON_ID=39447 /ORGANISM="" /LENGTH=112 /DNA_ID=CAMNT_0005300765 /DNA_START=836 /DNA_END=1174 /DNA_ORIENTATION=+